MADNISKSERSRVMAAVKSKQEALGAFRDLKQKDMWLGEILSLGATRDWRQVIREKTGEDLSSRAMLDYFKALTE